MPRYNFQNPKAEYKVDCVTFQKPRPKSSEVSEEDLGHPTRLDFGLRIYNAIQACSSFSFDSASLNLPPIVVVVSRLAFWGLVARRVPHMDGSPDMLLIICDAAPHFIPLFIQHSIFFRSLGCIEDKSCPSLGEGSLLCL